MNTINHSYNGINGSGNNDSSRSGSGSGSSISYIDGNHVPSSSSSSQHNQDRSHGPSSKFIVKDTILSPSTSGTTRDFKTCNATRGTDHRVDRSSSSSLSLSNNDTGLDQQQQHHHINDRSGNYSRTSQNNNNSSSSSSNNSSVLDVCRWIPTYTGEAFGLRHSVRACRRWGAFFLFFLSISIFISANVTYILIRITDTTASPSFYYHNKSMIIFDWFVFSKLTVTLTRPWYAHSPEIYVPLKLYSTVQDSSMTTSLHDDEEEGSWNRDEIIDLRLFQPESWEYSVCFSFDFLFYIFPSSSWYMYPFLILPSFPPTSCYTVDRLSWFLSTFFLFLFYFQFILLNSSFSPFFRRRRCQL